MDPSKLGRLLRQVDRPAVLEASTPPRCLAVAIAPLTRPPLGQLGFSDGGAFLSLVADSRCGRIRPAWPGAQSLHSLGSARPTRAALPGPAAPPLESASSQAAAARSLRREQQKREPQQAAPNNKSSLCRLRWPHPSALGWWTRTRGARSKNNTMIPAHLAGCRYARYPSFAVEMIPPRRKVFSSRSAGLRCLSSCPRAPTGLHPFGASPSPCYALRPPCPAAVPIFRLLLCSSGGFA